MPLDDPDALATLWRRNASDDDGERYLAALAHCLQSLPPTPRSAIELHYRHRQRHEDLAAKLGITSAGVKSLLRRARELLERCITNRLRSEP
ncbi:MAG TPA: sigma-70 region 4 domain-containing protein [Planctomycetota bacterium]|nr:sigma-70 region 4 domain-containing protein [Planctomycetota bacterium]